MFNSTYLDIAIGLIFVFLLLSLMVTTLNEIIASIFKLRSQMLRKAIFYMLSDKNGKVVANKIYNHPLINNPVDSAITPSYISSKDFATILIDIFTPNEGCGSIAARFENEINNLPNGEVKDALMALVKNAEGDVNKLRAHLENWFDAGMGRVTGWYKRKMQRITFILGFVICLAFHANTFTIMSHLAHDNESREKIVGMATDYIQKNSKPMPAPFDSSTKKNDDSIISQIDSLRKIAYAQINYLNNEGDIMGLGWPFAISTIYSKHWNNSELVCSSLMVVGLFIWNLFGILLTALAILLGAPFWFDLLNKLINIRNAGKKPEESTSVE